MGLKRFPDKNVLSSLPRDLVGFSVLGLRTSNRTPLQSARTDTRLPTFHWLILAEIKKS